MITLNYRQELESNILAILLVEPSKMEECYLEPRHFQILLNQRVYRIFQKFYEQNHTLDIATMGASTKDAGQFTDYCISLMDAYISSEKFQFYCDKLEEAYKSTEAEKVANNLLNKEIDAEQAVNVLNDIYREFVKTSNRYMLPADEIYDLVTSNSAKLQFREFAEFQAKVGIMQKTVTVLGARPGIGKTGFALNLINDLADRYKCIYFNMEMTEKELYERLVAINSNIPISRFTKLEEHEKPKLKAAAKMVEKKKAKIYSGSKSLKALRNICAKEQREEHCVVFIDHVGYVTTGKNQGDTERIGEVVRSIQLMTKDLNITVFLLCHINRAGSDTPTLNHLKDSGELEQSAHIVMLLHNLSDSMEEMECDIDCLIPKNRGGRCGKIGFRFTKTTQVFKMVTYGK